MKQISVLILILTAVLFAGAAWSAELVGYWSFDENQGTVAKTSAVSGYNGEIHGAKWVPGKVGSALEFNGTGDYVEVKDTADKSPFALTSMSMSAWIKPAAYPGGTSAWWSGIVGKSYYTGNTYGILLGDEGRVHFSVHGPFGKDGKVAPFDYRGTKDRQVSLNEWHYVVATYDNSNVKIYLDGRLDAVYKETRLPEINKQSIFIGATCTGYFFFKGVIDEVKIYKGTLTDAEVEAEYKKGGGTERLISSNLPKISEAPSLDGALSDPCWRKALKVDFVDNNTGNVPKAATTGYVCYDEKNLYIAFDCKEPFMNCIKANVAVRNGEIWNDDCVEAFIDPGLTRRNYYQFMLNSNNVQGNWKMDGVNNVESGWNGEWQSGTARQPDGWTAEMKIPLSNFALASDTGSSWGINLYRERKSDTEESSWSPTKGAFHTPEKFGIVREFNADFTPYKIAVSMPTLSYIFKSGKASLKLTQSFTNLSQDPRRVNIKIQNTSDVEAINKSIILHPGKAQELTIPISIKKDGNRYSFRTEITNPADGIITYNAVRTAKCPTIVQAYFDRSYYTDEKVANLEGIVNIDDKLPSSLNIRVSLQSQGKTVIEKTTRISGAKFEIPVNITSLPAGEYNTTITMAQGTNIIYAESIRLIKRPAADYAVKVDRKNLCMLVGGNLFFPIGMFDIPNMLIPEYAAAGFNLTNDVSQDIAYYNGMAAVASTFYNIPREYYGKLQPDALEDEIRNKGNLSSIVKRIQNHPAFFGYFWDEPNPEDVRGVEVLSKVTRDLDPYHPIMPSFWQPSGPTIPSDWYDVFMGAYYWLITSSAKRFDLCHTLKSNANTATEMMRKPFWFIPAAAGWSIQSAITPQEQRAQTYLGLIYGARGIVYWTYRSTYPAMRDELKRLAGELRELTPVLLTLSPQQTVTGVDDTGVHALAKMYNGDCYLLTANNSADEVKTVRIKVSSAGEVKSAKVLFENRTVPIKDGVLEDKFTPYATHVYVLQKVANKGSIQIAVQNLSITNIPLPKIRRWPDMNNLDDGVDATGFEDAEDGQPRLWNASCGWEMPEYCSISSSEFCEGSKSLKLSLPKTTLYTPKKGFGWSKESKVTSFDLGTLRQTCRYGHSVSNGLFKADLTNGKYAVKVLSNTSELFEMRKGVRQTLTIKTVEIPVSKGIINTIKENTFDTDVKDGQFSLLIPSGAIYSITFTPMSGSGRVISFDFGPNDCSVATDHKLVSASRMGSIYIISANNLDSWARIKVGKHKLSLCMKSDTPNLPVTFGMRIGVPWGPLESKTVKVGLKWTKYEVPITKNGEWVYVELNTPGTVWVDDFELIKN
jgi:hypothetical protein